MTTRRQFGRIAKPDDRDREFSVLRYLPVRSSARVSRYWHDIRWAGDQGNQPHCVAFAWLHWLADGPICQPGRQPCVKPKTLYEECQFHDEIPGNDYDGSTVRGGAKALRARGYVGRFLWAFTLEQVVNTLLEIGPVVIGVNWYDGMTKPDKKHHTIQATGDNLGGHAVLLNGVNTKTGLLRVKNSWGKHWGDNGRAFLPFEDFERLLNEDGEACIATEVLA